ncbi:lauroyl-Kdo(2)-lipid IV(A) myristoyltransferase [Photobacterium sp. J15]|uniref:lauroyl-Kdo(2)-lipid IV(A) myristoyltransferase n=1 Tax=Photobacterium sp. J15 TaxID=265901 RepID=UPI0007E43074|nr:lauroyl-Kdo(2)-lipid IV(A) myristoyltransferase [Photobacterium sp. J15]
MKDHFDPQAYHPHFKWSFLHPKFWGTWLAVGFAALFSLLPHRVRLALATVFAGLIMKRKSKANIRARVNLAMCFPEKSDEEREALLKQSLITAGTYLMGFAAMSTRSRKWLEQNTVIKGEEHLTAQRHSGQNTILLVPHTWAIDVPAVLLASRGLPVVGMAKKQKNDVTDWLMHKQRVQYGGRLYERRSGIKPFIRSIKEGYLGYYLPDEDLGPEHSVFVDFFAATKATMSGLGRLSKLSKASVLPLCASYNLETGQYEIEIKPPLDPFPLETEEQNARMMNACLEEFLSNSPEQYMWILRLLKTRPDGTLNPYKK